MERVRSKDGTSIAYERQGRGPAVILVGGGLDDGAENAPLAGVLSDRFTVYNYARRGRGDSGDTPPYELRREIEDIEALIGVAGGSASVHGVSSGGALVLEAAAAGLPFDRISVYEVPYLVDDDAARWWRAYVEQLTEALAEGRRADALVLFMRLAGSSDEEIAGARESPVWPGLEALAHTLAYDAACLGDGPPPVGRLATITRPTLVVTGRAAPDPETGRSAPTFFDEAADVIAATVPGARRRVVDGQGHVVDASAFAPVLADFLAR